MSALVVSGSETSELPFEKPTEFKLAINLRTARSIGVPPALLARADEVIECKKDFCNNALQQTAQLRESKILRAAGAAFV